MVRLIPRRGELRHLKAGRRGPPLAGHVSATSSPGDDHVGDEIRVVDGLREQSHHHIFGEHVGHGATPGDNGDGRASGNAAVLDAVGIGNVHRH